MVKITRDVQARNNIKKIGGRLKKDPEIFFVEFRVGKMKVVRTVPMKIAEARKRARYFQKMKAKKIKIKESITFSNLR